MTSGCSRPINCPLLPISAILAHINMTYGTAFTGDECWTVTTQLHGNFHQLCRNGISCHTLYVKFAHCSTFMPSSNSSLITGISVTESTYVITFTSLLSSSAPRISTLTYCNAFFKTRLSSFPIVFLRISPSTNTAFYTPHLITDFTSVYWFSRSDHLNSLVYVRSCFPNSHNNLLL